MEEENQARFLAATVLIIYLVLVAASYSMSWSS